MRHSPHFGIEAGTEFATGSKGRGTGKAVHWRRHPGRVAAILAVWATIVVPGLAGAQVRCARYLALELEAPQGV